MIKHLKPSLLDQRYLSVRPYVATPIAADLSKLIVTKPWGYEYLLLQHPSSELWHLSIKHNHSTSMHCHPKKKTALIVLEGRALFSSLDDSMELDPLDAIVIYPGTFHTTQAIDPEGAMVLELETPPMKHDIVRLEDRYGRAMSGYEDIDKMIVNGHQVRLSMHEVGQEKKLGRNTLCVQEIRTSADWDFLANNESIAIILSGTVLSSAGEIIHETGDVLTEAPQHDTVSRAVAALSITRAS